MQEILMASARISGRRGRAVITCPVPARLGIADPYTGRQSSSCTFLNFLKI